MMSELQSYLLGPGQHLVICSFGFILSCFNVALNLSEVHVCYYAGVIVELLSSPVGPYHLMLVIYGDYIIS